MITVKDEIELDELLKEPLEVGTEIKVLNYMWTGRSVTLKIEEDEKNER